MSLLDTIQELIPSVSVDVYGESICIRPLTLEKVGLLTPKIQSHWKAITDLGISLESLSGVDNKLVVTKLVSYFVTNGIDVLEDLTSVESEVFKALPLDKSVEIIAAVIEINASSAENLIKNWDGLTRLLTKYLPEPVIQEKT